MPLYFWVIICVCIPVCMCMYVCVSVCAHICFKCYLSSAILPFHSPLSQNQSLDWCVSKNQKVSFLESHQPGGSALLSRLLNTPDLGRMRPGGENLASATMGVLPPLRGFLFSPPPRFLASRWRQAAGPAPLLAACAPACPTAHFPLQGSEPGPGVCWLHVASCSGPSGSSTVPWLPDRQATKVNSSGGTPGHTPTRPRHFNH